MPDSPLTLVLIHGAWAGRWVWDGFAPLLQAQGFQTLAVDLPGSGHHAGASRQVSQQECVAEVLKQLSDRPGRLVLVGHSGGGVIATEVAEALAEQVAGVVYVAGMMLPAGLGFAELTRELTTRCPDAAGIGPHLLWAEDRLSTRVPPAAAKQIFLQDVPEPEASHLAEQLTPQAESCRALVPQWTAARFGRLPRLYVEARLDRSVVLAAQRRMQALVPGAEVVSLATGHVPQAADPGALAAVMAPFLQRCRAAQNHPSILS